MRWMLHGFELRDYRDHIEDIYIYIYKRLSRG